MAVVEARSSVATHGRRIAAAAAVAALFVVGFALGSRGPRADAPAGPRHVAPADHAPAIVSLRKAAPIPSLRHDASVPAGAAAAAARVSPPASTGARQPSSSGAQASSSGGSSGSSKSSTAPPKSVRRTSTE